MAIYYLDVDDEITSAAARIRDSSDSRIALVLSGNSRVATSRINFRLLAGEAKHRRKRLAIIASDPSVQSVARSAELPVYATVGEYEKSEADLARTAAGRPTHEVSDALDQLNWTVGPAAAAGKAGGGGMTRVPGAPANGSAKGRGRVPLPLVAGVAIMLAAALAAGGFFLYPSASVVLTLREIPVGPLTVNVKVDPGVSAANYQAGTVPGLSKAFPVEASGTFDATGQNVVDTAAAGTVTFSSINTVSAVPVVAGTRVTTAAGVAFTTTTTVDVPKATVTGDTITRGTVDAAVQAVTKGTVGNVPAGAIVKVPADLVPFQVSVSNKTATTGGTHTVTPKVLQADIDGAEAGLLAQLNTSFMSALKSPSAVPSGSSLFAETAQLGDTTCSPDPAGLVDQAVASFQLDCQGTGTATMTQMAGVTDLATVRARAAVRNGYSLVEDSVTAQPGAGTAQGAALLLPVTVQGVQVPVVDIDQLRAGVQGKSLDQARSFLSQFGEVDISVSPGWASTMPSFDFRIDIQLVNPSAPPRGSPSAGVGGSSAVPTNGAPQATAAGSATAAPGGSGSSAQPTSSGPSDSPTPVLSPPGATSGAYSSLAAPS